MHFRQCYFWGTVAIPAPQEAFWQLKHPCLVSLLPGLRPSPGSKSQQCLDALSHSWHPSFHSVWIKILLTLKVFFFSFWASHPSTYWGQGREGVENQLVTWRQKMNDIRDRAKYIIIPPPTLVHLLVNSGRTSSPCPLFFCPRFLSLMSIPTQSSVNFLLYK